MAESAKRQIEFDNSYITGWGIDVRDKTRKIWRDDFPDAVSASEKPEDQPST